MMSSKVELSVLSGPLTGQHFEFDAQESVLVGRSQDAHVQIRDDQHISRNHFLIEVKPPHCHIVDLDSANGTFVNDERVGTKWLVDGDRIRGGETEISVKLISEETPLAETMIGGVAEAPDLGATFVPPSAPESIGGYQIMEQVGQGAMGVVYRATHSQSGRVVALKTISPQIRLSEQLERSFIREAGILCGMSHKRIVEFIEVGAEDDSLFMAMEFVENIDLTATLAKLSFGKRVRVVSQLMLHVLEGLEYVHSQGLVHRDLKPKNILVYKVDGRLKAKIADFGLAKNFQDAGMSQISSEHEIKGTLCFIAPDQIANSRNVTPSVDLFSAGATFYTLLSDEVIYDLDAHNTPIASILNKGPVPLHVRCPKMPKALCKLVNKATRPTAPERFSSAAEMRAELLKIVRKF